MDKDLFGYISLIFALASYLPYMWSTMKGGTKPHVFTWIIWTLVMCIGTAGQYAGGAGAGAWSTTMTAVCCVIITAMSFKHGDKNITKQDVIIFVGALTAIPFWMMTDNPLTAIIIVTVIDVVAYIPTLRKARIRPHEEMAMTYTITNFKHIAGFFAMSTYSWTTLLYPSALFVINWITVGLIYYWRYKQGKLSGALKNFPEHPL